MHNVIKINSYHYTVVTNILDYAKKNHFRVCLEGVETVEVSLEEKSGSSRGSHVVQEAIFLKLGRTLSSAVIRLCLLMRIEICI